MIGGIMRKKESRKKQLSCIAACAGLMMILAACGAGKQTQNKTESTVAMESKPDDAEIIEIEQETNDDSTQNTAQDKSESDQKGTQKQQATGLSVQTETVYLSEYDENSAQLLAQEEYDLIHVKADNYPALEQAIAAQNEDMERAANAEYAENLAFAKETISEDTELPLGYTGTNEVKIGRVDDTVFSYVVTNTLNTGGAHPNYTHTGYTFNTQTGETVLFSEVVADKEAFTKKVIEALSQKEKDISKEVLSSDKDENTELFFGNWEDDVTERLQNELAKTKTTNTLSETAGIVWAMDAAGLHLYFSPYDLAPYAAGTITADIAYEDASLFQAAYLPQSKEAVLALDFYDTVQFDVNADGQTDSIYFLWQVTDEDSMAFSLVVRVNGILAAQISYGTPVGAWLMRSESGETWLYAELQGDNDYRTTEVFSLSTEKPAYVGSYNAAFFDDVPITPECFVMSEHLDALSTYLGTRKYMLSEDGLPTPLEALFTPDVVIEVTALRDVPAKLLAENVRNETEISPMMGDNTGTDGTIPSGTKLRFVRTDGAFSVDMLSSDGKLWRVSYNAENGWPILINGIDAEKCFDGIRYAG